MILTHERWLTSEERWRLFYAMIWTEYKIKDNGWDITIDDYQITTA